MNATRLVSLDSETCLIRPGLQAPPAVCFQFKTSTNVESIVHARLERDRLRAMLSEFLSEWTITGHNAAYDLCIVASEFPELFPAIFDAYESGRILCSLQRERLLDIAEGVDRRVYDLGSVASRYRNVPPADKNDPWRLRYGELLGIPVAEWPSEAVSYAIGDVRTQYAVHNEQSARAARLGPDYLQDEGRQAAADFWLKLCSSWGVHTDLNAVRVYELRERAALEAERENLIREGLVRADKTGTRNMKLAQTIMEQACIRAGLEVPTTATGAVSLDADSIALTGDELLESFQRYGAAKGVLSRIERLKFGERYPIQPRYTCLNKTGRTSCSQGDTDDENPSSYGFQLQNPPRVEGCRECFVPRPGRWFVFCDYSGMELRTWAFACLRLVGHSRLAEVLNSGKDPHTDLGAGLKGWSYGYAEAVYRGDHGKELRKGFKDHERQTAKIANFGYPGGMGPTTLVVQARAQYGVRITPDEAKELRDAWRNNWPESWDYFAFINQLLQGGERTTLQHLLSNRYRGGAAYCEAANSFFQGLAADIAKHAGFRIARECYAVHGSPLYGCRIWNFAHDEFMLEVPADPYRATLAADRLRFLMLDTARQWMPELEAGIDAEATIALRWSKSAETKYAQSGPYRGCMIPSEWDSATGLPLEKV